MTILIAEYHWFVQFKMKHQVLKTFAAYDASY